MTDMSELRMILIGPNILVIICATDRIFKGRNGSLLLKIDSFIHFRLFIFTRQYVAVLPLTMNAIINYDSLE